MAEFNGTEITDEMLEGVAGGVLDETSLNNLKAFVVAFKMSGLSLEETIEKFDFMRHGNHWNEVEAHIREFYAAA